MLYTSYYGNPHLDQNKVFPVQVSNSAPEGFPIKYVLKEVIPSWKDIVEPYKENLLSEVEYTVKYKKMLDSQEFTIRIMLEDIMEKASTLGLQDIVLLCYEKPGRFCHRHILAEWIKEKAGEEIEEYVNPDTFETKLF